MARWLTAPFLGYKIIDQLRIDDVLPYLNKKALYRISWGAANAKGDKWEQIQDEFSSKLTSMLDDLELNPWLAPQAAYGHWFSASNEDEITIYAPDDENLAITAFPVPRQAKLDGLCLAGYLPSATSGEKTITSLQVVTAGKAASRYIKDLFDSGNYVEGYFAHGLAAQFTEATAEFIHQHIRQELGIGKKQGKRYSWGYPALPNLDQHAILFKLIPVEERLGMALTSAYQLIPEQSTAALLIHHEKARYFRIDSEVKK